MRILTYFNTIKYLKLTQIYYRIAKRFIKPKAKKIYSTRSKLSGEWVTCYLYKQKLFADNVVNFLNTEGVIVTAGDWNSNSKSKLWLYNLHYFDDLCAVGAERRTEQHSELVNKWILDNPPPKGNGWEPYPTSLRIVNWVKAILSGMPADEIILNSLAQQADYLSQDLERHILGNHLFANAKALVFAGLFFNGEDADNWLQIGLKVFNSELDEQVLDDGGNFELSPMYHAIMLADILDLINIFTAFPGKYPTEIITKFKETAVRMIRWLKVMSHDDGEVSFFNDSAMGIAATGETLYKYAHLLGLNFDKNINSPYVLLEKSGYSRVTMPSHYLMVDHAQIGPDYLPGHAHADSLSFEWGVNKQRVLVNSGTSVYGISEERHSQRKTRSHNTVEVNNLDSSEVWSGFRVARRAYTKLKSIDVNMTEVTLIAEHDGYKRLKNPVTHQRNFIAITEGIVIIDKLIGRSESAIAYFYLHPSIHVVQKKDSEFIFTLQDNTRVQYNSSSKNIEMTKSNWHPEFGKNVPNIQFAITLNSNILKSEFCIQQN